MDHEHKIERGIKMEYHEIVKKISDHGLGIADGLEELEKREYPPSITSVLTAIATICGAEAQMLRVVLGLIHEEEKKREKGEEKDDSLS